MTAHDRRCACPLCIMADATLLLDRGKVEMAVRVLEGLPAALVAAVEAAHAKGLQEGRMGTRKKPSQIADGFLPLTSSRPPPLHRRRDRTRLSHGRWPRDGSRSSGWPSCCG
jgi:hypothetical protein